MYVTAQRVRDDSTGQVGINAYRYSHEGLDRIGVDWAKPDVEFLSQHSLGRLVSEICDMDAGGNSVLSFLDLAAHDSVDTDQLMKALAAGSYAVLSSPQFKSTIGGVTISFSLVMRIGGIAQLEYQSLRARIQDLLRIRSAPKIPVSRPVTILITQTASEATFELDPKDRERVDKIRGPRTPLLRLIVPIGVLSDFLKMHGEIFSNVTAMLIGGTRAQLMALGGVRFLDRADNKELWRYP